MKKILIKKIYGFLLLGLLSIPSTSLMASSTPALTPNQTAAVMGIVTNFILDDEGVSDIEQLAIEKIKAYASSNGTSDSPTIQDYIDAGVIGINNSNVADMNEIVGNLSALEVDTKEELQVLAVVIPTDTEAPIFTSLHGVSVKENTTYVVTLQATDTSTVTYSIEGRDAASFNVDADSGILSFKDAPDFETKELYYLTSFATDTSGNRAEQNMKVYILDVNESIQLKSKLINLHGSLWITNGQTEGTKLLKLKGDNGFRLSDSLEQLEIDGFTYFRALDTAHSAELWKTDGTPEETTMVKDIAIDKNSSSPHTFIEHNDLLHFVAYQKTNTGSTQIELWKSDGSESGTTKVSDITPPYGSSRILVKANNALYFPNRTPASDGTLNGNIELWVKNDLWPTGVVVRDLKRPSNGHLNDGSNPKSLTVFENKVYFMAEVSTPYNFPRDILQALCVSDGTVAGTGSIIYMRVKNIFSTGKKLYFSGYGSNNNGYELWTSDGTKDGTNIVKDINPGTMSSDPSNFIYINRLLYFVAFDDVHGYEVWRSDGTNAGTFMLKDMHTNNQRFPINPRGLYAVDGKLFISIDGDLWVSDGTVNGTKEIVNLPTMDLFTVYGELNGKLLFSARVISDTNTTVELWETDGTPTGSNMIRSVNYF